MTYVHDLISESLECWQVVSNSKIQDHKFVNARRVRQRYEHFSQSMDTFVAWQTAL